MLASQLVPEWTLYCIMDQFSPDKTDRVLGTTAV
jgi:hypothetical protein